MGRNFDVQPDTLRDAASTWRREAPEVAGALNRLRTRLDGLGEPWGGDEPGRAFGAQYQPNARKLMGAIEKLADGLGNVADGLDLMATRYERAEEASRVDRP